MKPVRIISLVVGMADYPAMVMHHSYDGGTDPMQAFAVTTGPCELVRYEPNIGAEVKRKESGWWKGEFWLDGVEWIDHGTDPTAMIAALESGEVDATYETKADSLPQVASIGTPTTEIATGTTIVIRTNINNHYCCKCIYSNPCFSWICH